LFLYTVTNTSSGLATWDDSSYSSGQLTLRNSGLTTNSITLNVKILSMVFS
jgi:hypothetical protein